MTSNTEILAAWILFATRAGENGRIVPTQKEIDAIVTEEPERWTEALAIADVIVKKIVKEEPRNVVQAAGSFLREVNNLQERVGGFLNAAPVKGRSR